MYLFYNVIKYSTAFFSEAAGDAKNLPNTGNQEGSTIRKRKAKSVMTEYEEEMLRVNKKHIQQRIENEKEIHKKEMEILEIRQKTEEKKLEVEEKKLQVLEKYLNSTNVNKININSL